jgi:hypothetical protein
VNRHRTPAQQMTEDEMEAAIADAIKDTGATGKKALQDIADRLMAYTISQIGQRPGNPVITPVPVLLGQTNDQLLDLARHPRPAWAATGFRAIELAGDQLVIPGQDGVGLATVATSARAVRPSRCPISPSVERSASERFRRPFNWAFRKRFLAVKYSFRVSI